MTEVAHRAPDTLALADDTIALVRRWLASSAEMRARSRRPQLAGVLRDPQGLPFTVGFVDGVIRPEDPRVAARNFATLARDVPAFLPWHLRTAVRLGGAAGSSCPGLVIPIVRRALRPWSAT